MSIAADGRNDAGAPTNRNPSLVAYVDSLAVSDDHYDHDLQVALRVLDEDSCIADARPPGEDQDEWRSHDVQGLRRRPVLIGQLRGPRLAGQFGRR